MAQGQPFEMLQTEVDPLVDTVTDLRARVLAAEARLAAGADTTLPWWQQKVGPVPSWVIVGGIGVAAFLGWWRSR